MKKIRCFAARGLAGLFIWNFAALLCVVVSGCGNKKPGLDFEEGPLSGWYFYDDVMRSEYVYLAQHETASKIYMHGTTYSFDGTDLTGTRSIRYFDGTIIKEVLDAALVAADFTGTVEVIWDGVPWATMPCGITPSAIDPDGTLTANGSCLGKSINVNCTQAYAWVDTFDLYIVADNGTSWLVLDYIFMSGLPTPGTYVEGPDITYGKCTDSESVGSLTYQLTSSLTITDVSSGRIAGYFYADIGGGEHLSGSFDVPLM